MNQSNEVKHTIECNKDVREYCICGADETTQPEHTPTPWKVARQARPLLSLIYAGEQEIDYLASGLTNQDADFIVRAVNSHAELIQAVKDLRYAFYVENNPKKLKEAFSKHADSLREIIAADKNV